jgi:hypothetical protein
VVVLFFVILSSFKSKGEGASEPEIRSSVVEDKPGVVRRATVDSSAGLVRILACGALSPIEQKQKEGIKLE